MSLHPWGHWWPESYLLHSAGHRRLSLQCVCVHQWKKGKDGARVQKSHRKSSGSRPAHGSSAVRGFICVWGLRTSRKAKVLLKLDGSSGCSVGSEEEETEEQQLYNFIYATLYLLSHPSHCQVTAAYCDPKGKHTHTHLLSTWKHSLKPCCRWLRVVRPLRAQRKSLRLLERVALHAWSGRIATNDTTQPQHDTSGTELFTERHQWPSQQGGWWESTQRMLKRCSFSDL